MGAGVGNIGMRTTEDSVKKLCYRFLHDENTKAE